MDKEITVLRGIYGLMPVAWTNANTYVVCIKDVLLRMNLRILDVCGQCYGGCSTTTGTKNGVAAQIKKLNRKYVDALLLSLTLAVQDTTTKKFNS